MYRTFLFAKIHRATVTAANVHYVGSITIDSDLLAASGIRPYERVQVVDVDNGERLETYVIAGPPAAARSSSTARPLGWCRSATRSSSWPTPWSPSRCPTTGRRPC